MAKADFQKLQVYQLAEQLADEIWRVVQGWEPFARNTVGAQMVRACGSVGANIAEGLGRATYKDNCRFVAIARGSLNETVHWLRRAYAGNLLRPEQVERLKTLTEELGPRLNACLRVIRQRSRGSTTGDHR